MSTPQTARQPCSPARTGVGGRHRPEVRAVLALAAAATLLAGCGGPEAPSVAPTAAGDDIVTSFLAVTQAPDRSVHVDAAGVARFSGAEMKLASAYDVSGDDHRGSTTVEASAMGTWTVHSAVVDGIGYTSGNGTDWAGAQPPTPPQDPFRGLVVGDVEYAGPIDANGTSDHLLRLRDPVEAFTRAMAVTSPQGMGALTTSSASFDVRVDQQGRPVTATLVLRGTSATVGDVEVDVEYAFRDWGAIAPIEPPIDIPPTPDPAADLTVYNRVTADILLRDGSGAELPVPACGTASATTFDTSQFDVLLASSGEVIYAQYPAEEPFVTRVVLVGSDRFQMQPGPYQEELPPCVALVR